MSNKFSMPVVFKEVGSKLRFLREERGLTLNDLAEVFYKEYKIKLNPNLMGKIERGEARINIQKFLLICRFFNIDISYFYPDYRLGKYPPQFDSLIQNPTTREIVNFLNDNLKHQHLIEFIFDIIKLFTPKLIHLQKNIEIEMKDKIATGSLKASSKNKK